MKQDCSSCGLPTERAGRYCHGCHAAYMRRWRRSHPLTGQARRRANARSYANVYLRRGLLTRGPCVDCGIDPSDAPVEMHHAEYSKPLDVTWLCPSCRLDRHLGT